MRLILDENLDVLFAQDLSNFEVSSVKAEGWKGLVNGNLLDVAQVQFDALISIDKNMPFQTNVSKRDIAVVVLDVLNGTIDSLRSCLPGLAEALPTVQPGQVYWVKPTLPDGSK